MFDLCLLFSYYQNKLIKKKNITVSVNITQLTEICILKKNYYRPCEHNSVSRYIHYYMQSRVRILDTPFIHLKKGKFYLLDYFKKN